MPDRVRIRRALLSVSDKTDLVPFASALASMGVELISTGGTARALADAGLTVSHVEAITGFPEMLDGRVKTLHPAVHGAILARRDLPAHMHALDAHGFKPIDLVCVNLYPFEQTTSHADTTFDEAIEQIDIGGPSMIRSAAKNASAVAVVTAPPQYDRVVSELRANDGCLTHRMRAELAAAAFARTSAYDAAISAYLSRAAPAPFPATLRLTCAKVDDLRYGENPHQSAALYRDSTSTGPTIVNARQLGGKQLSYNNMLDAAAALELVKAFARVDPARPGACVVKHTNPCGASIADSNVAAIEHAIKGDPLAAYGGILAINRPLLADDAHAITTGGAFFEVVVAPECSPDAASILLNRWANVRVLAVGNAPPSHHRKLEYRSIPGGLLVQDRDILPISTGAWQHRAGPPPSDADLQLGAFLVSCVRALSSNAVVLGGYDAQGVRIFGSGSGQVDRVNACRIAVAKADMLPSGSIAVSEAFFPFPDGPALLIEAGVRAIIHPGGSRRDEETFALCEAKGVTCLTTGQRHFRH